MEMKLEVVVVPISDVDRAKCFYEMLGWSAAYTSQLGVLDYFRCRDHLSCAGLGSQLDPCRA